MGVDYRLLEHFAERRRRLEEARNALPERWKADPRPEAQLVNELWVSATLRAREHIERVRGEASARPDRPDDH